MGYILDDFENRKILKENYSDAVKRRLQPLDSKPKKKQDEQLLEVIRKRKMAQYGGNPNAL